MTGVDITRDPGSEESIERTVEIADNRHVQALVGPQNANLESLARASGVVAHLFGNRIVVTGPIASVLAAETSLLRLQSRAAAGHSIEPGDVAAAVRMAAVAEDPTLTLRTRKRSVQPRSAGQALYLKSMRDHALVFALGPAGTGKTYLAVAQAVALKLAGEVDRIVLSRPAVEAGERLGFLPGDMREKIDPYLRPLYDALHDMLPGDQVARLIEAGEIEVAPLAFMRGRTLAHAFVILDEAQNTTPVQMKMFLTRLGEGSRMVVAGDQSQVDLPRGALSGLDDALETLHGVLGVGRVDFTHRDVVRHDLVTRIVQAYDSRARARLENVGPGNTNLGNK